MIKEKGVDKTMTLIVMILCTVGLVMVLSATLFLGREKYSDHLFFFKRQLLWLLIGLAAFLFILNLKKPLYMKQSMVYLGITLAVLLLGAVFFTGRVNGSYRWIRIWGFSIQPSEFAKIAVILYLSQIFSREDFDVNDIRKTLVSLIPVMIIGVLLLKEPDLGNFFLVLSITGMFVYFAGIKIRYLMAAVAAMVPLVWVVFIFNEEKFQRILALFRPEQYSEGLSYQMMQSLYAVGSGGLFGLGAGNSTQKLSFLPYAYSDFIFSIIGEEFGFIGASLVILLFVLFLIKGITIARSKDHKHAYMLVCGFTLLIVFQAIINISVSIGIMPTNGIPLPFISCGGSSLISSLMIAGIIIHISKLRKPEIEG